MADMASFCNLLVHLYGHIDYERMYDNLPDRLASLEACASHIGRWLQDQSEVLRGRSPEAVAGLSAEALWEAAKHLEAAVNRGGKHSWWL